MRVPTGADKFGNKIKQNVDKALPATKAGLKKVNEEKLAQRLSLKKKLKKALTGKRADDLAITEIEQQEIYSYVKDHISPELAEKHNIKNVKQLMKFIGLSKIKEQAKYEKFKDMAENNPEGFCYSFDEFKSEPWAKKMIIKLIPKQIKYLSKTAHKLIDMEWAEDVYKLIIPHDPEAIYWISCARGKLQQHPMFKRLLFLAADLKPYLSRKWLAYYKTMPYAKELFIKGLEKEKKETAWVVVDKLKDYYEMPWAKDLVGKYLPFFTNKENADPLFFRTVELGAANMPWMKDIYLSIAPFVTEKYVKKEYSKFKDQPWAEDFLLKCFKSQAKVDKFINKNQPQSGLFELLEEIKNDPTNMEKQAELSKLASLEPVVIFKNINSIKGLMVRPEELLMSAALSRPKLAFTYLSNYINEPYAKDVLLTAVKIKPEFAFYYSSIIKNLPNNGGKEVLLSAVKNNKAMEKLAVIYFSNYQDVPWATEILDQLTSSFLLYPEYLKLLPPAKVLKIIKKMAKKRPLYVLLNFDTYLRNIPGSAEAFDIALKEFRNSGKFYVKRYHNIFNHALKEPDTKKKYIDMLNKVKRDKKELSKFDEILNVMLNQNIKTAGKGKSDIIKLKFLDDPPVKLAIKIKPDWLDPKPKNNFLLQQFRVMIARNIYIENKSVTKLTKELVQKTYKSLLEGREKMKNQTLFKDRHVVYLSGNEKLDDGKYRFGNPAVFKSIKDQKIKSLTSFRATINTKEECEKVKKQFLDKIVNTKPPLTLVFDAHGTDKGVHLSELGIKVRPADIAKALSKRYKKLQQTPALFAIERDNPPIIIYDSCYASTIVRSVYAKMDKQSIQPIQIGAAEYNLSGYTNFSNKYGSRFMSHVMNLKKRGYISTIGTIMKNERKGESNPAIYIPTKFGTQVQIAELQGPTDEMSV